MSDPRFSGRYDAAYDAVSEERRANRRRSRTANIEAPRHLWDVLARGPGPGYEETLDWLVRHYQGLVTATAYKFKSTLPSFIVDEDLLSYGQLGLLKAIERYDPDLGPFRRFASSYVYGAILDELRSQDWAPRGLRREQRLVRQATTKLQNSEDPSLSSVAASLGWEAARLESTMRQVQNSHHQTLEGAETEDGVQFHVAEDVDGMLSADAMCATFCEIWDAFDEVTQYVLVRVYFMAETLTAVAQTTSLPLAVVRRIHTEAVNYLYDQVRAGVAG